MPPPAPAPPFKPKDATLFALVSSFDAAYAAYADFQANMERYWCLRWLAQQGEQEGAQPGTRQLEAVVLKEEVVRLADLPLADFQAAHSELNAEVFDVLGVDKAVAAFVSYGSTAPHEVARQVSAWKEKFGL